MTDADQDPGTQSTTATATADEPTSAALLGLLRQERADFQNYRRRVEDERAAAAGRVRGQVLEPIFPILDDLDRAFAEIPDDLRSDPWAQGIALTRARLRETLLKLGLDPVGVVGEPFDPTQHEAIVYESDPDATDQTVALIIRPGYRVDGRLLRPAEVVVRGPRPTAADASESRGAPSADDSARPGSTATDRPTDDLDHDPQQRDGG